MSQDFIKALLITGIVFGLAGLLLGVGLLFHSRSRPKGVKCLLRSSLDLIVFLTAFYFFQLGLIADDFSLVLVLLVFGFGSLTLEAVMNRSLRSVLEPPRQNRGAWFAGKTSKRQFVLITSLAPGLILVIPAIAFRIVVPEEVPVYWWLILIGVSSSLAFVLASWYWNSQEKKFGSRPEFS